jgi:ankyrin repeat protein
MSFAGEPTNAAKALAKAVCSNSPSQVSDVLTQHPELTARLDDPLPDYAFGGTALLAAVHRGNREMIDVLLRAGANINARSHWWAGSFGVLDHDGDLAPFLIERGAVVDVHAAARLGMLDRLHELVSANPALVHARGGDGQTPLRFAGSVAVAEYLLDRGADLDARDVDHESTPAQWMIRDRQEIVRYLLGRGCGTDILGDDEYHARPLGWTIHGSLHGWHRKTGDYGATLQALLQAGAIHPTASEDFEGSDAVRDVLRRWTQNPPR